MGTRIDSASKSTTGTIVPASQTLQPTAKPYQETTQKEFLKDRFEHRDPAEQPALLISSQIAVEDTGTLKAFDLMLDEKNQPACEFMISSPTGTVAMWWGELSELARLLPEDTSAKVTPLDTETRQILMSLHEAAPHRKIMLAERQN